MHKNESVRRSLRCELTSPGARLPANQIPAEVVYDSRDPFAVAFYLDKDGVRWLVDRGLLAAGLEAVTRAVGEGDVRIRRVIALDARDSEPRVLDEVELELSSPSGPPASVWFPAADVEAFLQASYAVVRDGGEGPACDAALEKLGRLLAAWSAD
ncbi:SsgA family sporulation/cell division regulator [Actinophytocola sp.]|uniref:SsgA family sporulation/cell division regulator n=1 Tax=Actinophytocola sp. TaxID=1872138 RepID=UPI002ED50590